MTVYYRFPCMHLSKNRSTFETDSTIWKKAQLSTLVVCRRNVDRICYMLMRTKAKYPQSKERYKIQIYL